MTIQSPKVIFFGSGPVAAESLKLLSRNFDVEAVITRPKPAHHRGSAPVIDFARQAGLPHYTPANKAELSQFFNKPRFESRVGIVIDYGIIIAKDVIDRFEYGIINSHFSLLPQWRGADPITFSILSGQAETGVSLMRINEKMDEGPLLAQEKLVIQATDTSKELTQKLIQLSDQILAEHLPTYLAGSLKPRAQQGEPTYSRKLSKQDGTVDWAKPAEQIEREVRAYYEWPKSTARIGARQVILRSADVIKTSGEPGNYSAAADELVVFCGRDALKITSIQPVNKKEMSIQAFLRGYTL